ncbi:MAG: sulfite exporter TauE/SafE family protein [Candidatus Tectomicrobia bacterium]
MDFEITDILVRLFLGLLIGFCIGLTGVGGGVLVMPALTVLLKMPAAQAVATASLYAFLTKVDATYHHIKLKTIEFRTGIPFLIGAVPGNIAAALLVRRYASDSLNAEVFQNNLRLFIAWIILLSAVIIAVGLLKKDDHNGARLAEKISARPTLRNALAILLGGGIGALVGATSIGGGSLVIPLLIIIFGLSASHTVGTSILIAVVLTAVSSVVYGGGGFIDYPTAIVMSVGSIGGVPLGSKLSTRLPERPLKIIVVCIMILSGIVLLLKQGH